MKSRILHVLAIAAVMFGSAGSALADGPLTSERMIDIYVPKCRAAVGDTLEKMRGQPNMKATVEDYCGPDSPIYKNMANPESVELSNRTLKRGGVDEYIRNAQKRLKGVRTKYGIADLEAKVRQGDVLTEDEIDVLLRYTATAANIAAVIYVLRDQQ